MVIMKSGKCLLGSGMSLRKACRNHNVMGTLTFPVQMYETSTRTARANAVDTKKTKLQISLCATIMIVRCAVSSCFNQ